MLLREIKRSEVDTLLELYSSRYDVNSNEDLNLARNIIESNTENDIELTPALITSVRAFTQTLARLARETSPKSGHMASVVEKGTHYASARINNIYRTSDSTSFSACLVGEAVVSVPNLYAYGIRQSLFGDQFATFQFDGNTDSDSLPARYFLGGPGDGLHGNVSIIVPMKRWLIKSGN